MNYGSEPADQVVRYSLEGAEFALRISGTAAKNFFIFAQAVLHDSKKTHGKTHLIRLLKEQKPLKFFTVDKERMHDFARAAKAHGLLFCPIRDKMDPDHIEIAILQDDASKANRIIEKLQLDVVDTGTAELVDAVQQNLENAAPNHKDTPTVDFPLGSENASPSEPFSDSSKSFANSPSPRTDQLRAKGERPSVRMELSDITAYLLRALGDVYYGQRANGGSTEVTGRLILRVNDLPAGGKLTMSAAEYRLAKAALNQLRTQRLAEGGYTDAVDDALARLLHAHTPLLLW